MVEMHVDKDEAFEMAVSILAIALVFTFYDRGLSVEPSAFIFYMAAGVITLGSGFVMHELAHKYFAIRYGARARFKAWPAGLALALALVVVPQIIWGPAAAIFFIAPGAVYIYALRGISIRQNGIISLAGPAMNWAVAAVFLALAVIFSQSILLSTVLLFGFRVNLMLALFNLIPIPPLDGSKVVAWDWRVWLGAVLVSFFGMGIPGIFGL
ncbi:MAG: site-2 protease family protein [Candidatus Micrarchaeota archaeon]|nr:site-2 protease family protein [Candidatus Micrarchaeota archaeon]